MPSAKISPCNGQHVIRTNCGSPIGNKCTTPIETICRNASYGIEEKENEPTPYQKMLHKLHYDETWQKDKLLGKRIGFYRLRRELGSGNFSQVKSAVHCLTNGRVAVKILDKSKLDQKTQRMLSREIVSMESLYHPHIIRLFEVIETMSKIYLVMEHASGGELFHRISNEGRFTEHDAKPIIAQITDAVDYMHTHKIIHRDLKAENVFFSAPGHIKVGDFGFSTQVHTRDQALRTFCGSPPYAAPELFQDESYMGPAVDIWALGVLLYFMLTATMPFKSQTVSGLKKLIIEGHFTIPDYLSMDCHWLIYGLLKRNPRNRHTIDQIKKSRWLTGQPVPQDLPQYNFQPPSFKEHSFVLSKEEMMARTRLRELGITETMIEDSWGKGIRSDVTGTYRILLHYLANPTDDEDLDSDNYDHSCTSLLGARLGKRDSEAKSEEPQLKKSRTCTIL